MDRIVRAGTMHQAAVVPDDQVANSPAMLVGPRRLASLLEEIVQKSLRRLGCHPVQVVSMAPGVDRSAPGLWMDLDYWASWRALVVEAVLVVRLVLEALP